MRTQKIKYVKAAFITARGIIPVWLKPTYKCPTAFLLVDTLYMSVFHKTVTTPVSWMTQTQKISKSHKYPSFDSTNNSVNNNWQTVQSSVETVRSQSVPACHRLAHTCPHSLPCRTTSLLGNAFSQCLEC